MFLRLLGMIGLALAMVGTTVAARADDGPQGRNPRLFIVPASDDVVIDGRLDDWDRSGAIESFVDPATRETRRIITYAMYDEQSLYLAGEVWDDVAPMMNRHDPHVSPERAWDADAFQFRIYLDPRFPGDETQWQPEPHHRMVHLLLWYYTDRQEPNLQLQYSMGFIDPPHDWPGGVVPHEKFDAAYRLWDDGDGYTFEYRIPWNVLSEVHRPQAGDVTAASIQVQWSRPDGLGTLRHEGWVIDLLREPGFPYQRSDIWGKAIFAERGNLAAHAGSAADDAREPTEPPTPLSFQFQTPRDGDVSVGVYDRDNVLRRQVLAQASMPAGTHTIHWDGLDDQGEPLPAGDYALRGVIGDPLDTQFILSLHNAGDPPYKTDDGTGGWGADHGDPTTVAAAGERMLLAWSIAESGWGIIATDLEGKKQWGTVHSAMHLASDGKRFFAATHRGAVRYSGVRVYDIQDARPLNYTSGRATTELPAGGDEQTNRVTGLTYAKGRLYVALAARDMIVVNDADTGEVLETWSVSAPGELAMSADNELIAISDGRLVRVRGGETALFTDAHLDDPQALAIDAEGRIYVTHHGALHNVSVFSAQGEHLTSIGTPGGRASMGPYEPDGMLNPRGCAIDAHGRLWVAEAADAPRRISVWDTRTGAHLDEFFGGSNYFSWAWIDPRRPDEAYCHNVLWKIDLEKRTDRIHSTIYRRTEPNQPPNPNTGGYGGHFRVITADNGRQYGWGMTGRRRGHVMFMREGDVFRPIAGLIAADADKHPALTEYLRKLNAQWDEQGVPSHHRPRHVFWQDLNGDGRIDAEELTPVPLRVRSERFFNWIARDLSVWNESGSMLRPVTFRGDQPIYDFEKLIETSFQSYLHNSGGIWFDDRHDDGIYLLNPAREHTLSKHARDGALLWSTGFRDRWQDTLGKPAMQPGDLWGMTMPLGLAGQFTGVATYFGGFHLFTRDGIYVGMIMRPRRAGGGLGPDITASETITGQLVKPDGMDRYFLLAGDQDGRITEIHGLDTIERLTLTDLSITDADRERVIEAQRAYDQTRRIAAPPFVQRPLASLDDRHGAVRVRVDDRRSFEAQLAHDREHLYARYRVSSASPLINGQSDLHRVFTGGNLLDIQLATDAEADPDREAPAPGDLRLLLGQRANGEPLAVLFRPRVADFDDEPTVLHSPTGSESFDVIEQLDNVQLEHTTTDEGFEVTVAVPLDAIGWHPVSGQAVRLDLGYIFGNATGTNAEQRAYWHNNSFTANVVDDVPHESRLEPHEWGTAIVE